MHFLLKRRNYGCMALDKEIIPHHQLNFYCKDVLSPFLSSLHLTLFDLSHVTSKTVSFLSRHCSVHSPCHVVESCLILGRSFQVARTVGNGSVEYCHSWLVGSKLIITSDSCCLLLSSIILEIYSEPLSSAKAKVDLP